MPKVTMTQVMPGLDGVFSGSCMEALSTLPISSKLMAACVRLSDTEDNNVDSRLKTHSACIKVCPPAEYGLGFSYLAAECSTRLESVRALMIIDMCGALQNLAADASMRSQLVRALVIEDSRKHTLSCKRDSFLHTGFGMKSALVPMNCPTCSTPSNVTISFLWGASQRAACTLRLACSRLSRPLTGGPPTAHAAGSFAELPASREYMRHA